MLKKRWIILMGATILTVAALAGVTYAWFTSEKIDTLAVIDTGRLDIGLKTTVEDIPEYDLYPQLTVKDEDNREKPAPIEGTEFTDVLTKSYKLENRSSRDVVVMLNVRDMLTKGKVTGSQIDGKNNVIYEHHQGKWTAKSKDITNPTAVKFRHDIDFDDSSGVIQAELDGRNELFFYMPEGTTIDIGITVWLDGELGTNEYQNGTIKLDSLTAKAAQYRAPAMVDAFKLTDEQQALLLAEILDMPLQ